MKLTEFIKWVEEYPDQVVKDSGGTIAHNHAGIMAYDALRRRGRLWGETERVAASVCIPKHSENAAEFFDPEFFYDAFKIANLYKWGNLGLSAFLQMACEAQNTRLMALAFTEINPDDVVRLINETHATVDAYVAYFKYAKAFKVIEYIRGPGLPDAQRALTLLSRHNDLWSDCTFSSRWIHNACREWVRGNKLSAESILINIRQYIFAAVARKCFEDRELIPAAKMTLDKLGINYEPAFSV